MEKTAPFFSIVIPTLNEEHYLPHLLQSLSKQTFKNFEVIVSDGHSTDKTSDVVKTFQKKIALLAMINAQKRNVCFQRNLGAKNATGRYLVFFDADCVIERKFLQKVYNHIQKEESLLLTTWLEPDSKEVIDELIILLTNFSIELARYTKKAFIPGFNIIIERNVFWVIGGFDEKVIHAEDIYLAQNARKKGIALRFLREPILTVSMRRFRSEGRLEVFQKYLKSTTHVIFKGPITKELFEYQMGGEYHLHTKKKGLLETLRKKLLY